MPTCNAMPSSFFFNLKQLIAGNVNTKNSLKNEYDQNADAKQVASTERKA